MKILSKEQVLAMDKNLIDEYGGIHGLRDAGLLDSALASAFQTFGGQDLYPTVIEKAAQLCFSFTNNHAFIDGNKRIGVLVMLVFLEINGYTLVCSDEDLITLGFETAAGKLNKVSISQWIIDHTD